MQFNADHLAEGHLRSQKDGAPHAGSQVDKRKVTHGRSGSGSLPTLDQAVKHRRSDAVVGRGVPIVMMAALEMTPRDQAAGAHAIGNVEGMAHESVGNGEAGQTAARGCFGHECTVAYGGS